MPGYDLVEAAFLKHYHILIPQEWPYYHLENQVKILLDMLKNTKDAENGKGGQTLENMQGDASKMMSNAQRQMPKITMPQLKLK